MLQSRRSPRNWRPPWTSKQCDVASNSCEEPGINHCKGIVTSSVNVGSELSRRNANFVCSQGTKGCVHFTSPLGGQLYAAVIHVISQ